MQIKRFTSPQEFDKHASPFLITREAEHNLMLGLIQRAIHQPDQLAHPPYMAIVADDQIVAVSIRTPPHNALLSHIDPQHLDRVLDLLVDNYCKAYGTLPGVVGHKDSSKLFAQKWSTRTGQPYRKDMEQRIYQLTDVTHPQEVSGTFRPATASDHDLATRWIGAFQREIFNEEQTQEQLDGAFQRVTMSDRELLLWEDNNQIVSMAGVVGISPNGVRVAAVYTPPEHRRKGYAGAVVATLSQRWLDRGKQFCFLYTDLSNPTSNHIYQQIGYRPVCDVDVYKFADT